MAALLNRIAEMLKLSILARIAFIMYLMSGDSTQSRPKAPKCITDLVVRRALDLFQKTPAHPWTLEELSRTLGISRPALGRRFSESLGQSPLRALRAIRIEKAQQLLLETDYGLAKVAAEVGYESEFAFSRAFTRHVGLRPGQFRRTNHAPVMRAA